MNEFKYLVYVKNDNEEIIYSEFYEDRTQAYKGYLKQCIVYNNVGLLLIEDSILIEHQGIV